MNEISNFDHDKSAKKITFEILDKMKAGTRFGGIEITLKVKARTGVLHFPDTILRYMREYRRNTGRGIINVNKKKSIYQVVGK